MCVCMFVYTSVFCAEGIVWFAHTHIPKITKIPNNIGVYVSKYIFLRKCIHLFFALKEYRVSKMPRMPEFKGLFPQKSPTICVCRYTFLFFCTEGIQSSEDTYDVLSLQVISRQWVWGARRRSALARSCRAPTGSDQSNEDWSNRGVYSNLPFLKKCPDSWLVCGKRPVD